MAVENVIVPIARDERVPNWQHRALLLGPPGLCFAGLSVAINWRFAALSSAALFAFMVVITRYFDRSRRLTFVVGDGKLEVKGDPMFSETFALSEFDLDRSEAVDISVKGPRTLRWKTCGTGMPGYWVGEFSLRSGEAATVFISDRQRVLYIPRRHPPR
jgi:hypothetical protein